MQWNTIQDWRVNSTLHINMDEIHSTELQKSKLQRYTYFMISFIKFNNMQNKTVCIQGLWHIVLFIQNIHYPFYLFVVHTSYNTSVILSHVTDFGHLHMSTSDECHF